jgi:hypothetical protein
VAVRAGCAGGLAVQPLIKAVPPVKAVPLISTVLTAAKVRDVVPKAVPQLP